MIAGLCLLEFSARPHNWGPLCVPILLKGKLSLLEMGSQVPSHCWQSPSVNPSCQAPSQPKFSAASPAEQGHKGLFCPPQGAQLPWWLSGKESACQCRRRGRHGFDPWVGKIPWRRKQQPTPLFLSGKSHRQRNLAGYSPWRCKESNMTERLRMHACKGAQGENFQRLFTKRTSLVVQWLRLYAPNTGDLGLIPGQETGTHMLQLKIKDLVCCN